MSFSYADGAKEVYDALYQYKNPEEREAAMVEIIKKYNLAQRVAIRKYYDGVYAQKSLLEDFEDRLAGHFRTCTKHLFMDPVEYDVLEIFYAFDKFTYDKKNIYEYATSRPYWMLQKIKEKFKEKYNKDIELYIKEKFDPDIANGLIALFNTERSDVREVDMNKCQALYRELKGKKPKEWLHDQNIFKKIFASCSPAELIMIGRYFYMENKQDLTAYITSELSSDEAKFLNEILYNTCRPCQLFAMKINEACTGLGTNEYALNRILGTRNEIDMKLIKKLYKYLYNVELEDDIREDTKGNYRELLCTLINKQQ